MFIIHLAGEDKLLYPKLKNSGNAKAASTAEKFENEMGGIAQVATAYSSKWQASAIRDDPAAFISESKGLLDVLGKRIEQENSVLYPLADSL